MAEPPEAHGLPPLTADRLAGLSDTMFGVAMTLLATTIIPQAEQLTGSALGMLHRAFRRLRGGDERD